MRITDIETSQLKLKLILMLDVYYRIATPLLMGSYSIMNDAKISVKPTWQTSKRIGEEREKCGGLGRDERFSPLSLP